MNLRIPLAVAMIAIAGTLTSCTVGNPNPPEIDNGVGANTPTGAPTETITQEPTETVVPEVVETTPPEADGSAVEVAPAPDGAPVPEAELAGSRTAKQLRFIASRLDEYLAVNGVPAN